MMDTTPKEFSVDLGMPYKTERGQIWPLAGWRARNESLILKGNTHISGHHECYDMTDHS